MTFANSTSYNAGSLEYHWYAAYQRAFKKLEDSEHCVALCPQFTVSRIFDAAEDGDDASYLPTDPPDDPQEHTEEGPSQGSTPEDDKTHRGWKIPDFAVLATPHPIHSEILVGKPPEPPVQILVPSLRKLLSSPRSSRSKHNIQTKFSMLSPHSKQ